MWVGRALPSRGPKDTFVPRLKRSSRETDLIIAMPGSSKGPRGQYLQLAQWKVEVLGLIAEQGAIPVDQLVRFLRVKPTEGPKIVNQLRDTGCVEIKTLVAGD